MLCVPAEGQYVMHVDALCSRSRTVCDARWCFVFQVEDAQAAMRLYMTHRLRWEKELRAHWKGKKAADKKQKKAAARKVQIVGGSWETVCICSLLSESCSCFACSVSATNPRGGETDKFKAGRLTDNPVGNPGIISQMCRCSVHCQCYSIRSQMCWCSVNCQHYDIRSQMCQHSVNCHHDHW